MMSGAARRVERCLHRPAAFARVLDVAFDAVKPVGVFLERRVTSARAATTDDGAVAPELTIWLRIKIEVGVAEQLEALGVRLHHSVLDPVVDHLSEVAGAVRTACA